MEEEVVAPVKTKVKTDRFEELYKELLKRPQGDVMVNRIKAFLK